MRGRVWLTRCIAGAVLFAGPFTAIAQAPLAGALPGRTVELVDARDLFAFGGGIHCITQQQPAAKGGAA